MSDGDLSGMELNGIEGKEAKGSSNNCVLKPWKSLRVLGQVLKALINVEKFQEVKWTVLILL